ncbi:MAG TPA: translation initiation factor IF-1 [Candidatus Aquicultoraceae bacterium]|nr:translation initiation factor IF-1 [Candidatus Aquicultoraceae bacterium]
MSKADLAKLEGTVTDTKGGGNYIITLENGVTLSAKLSGTLKRHKIRVVQGDSVTVGVSPYDTTHGLILYRHNK